MTFWQSETWSRNTTSIYESADTEGGLSPASETVALWRRASDFDVVVTLGDRTSLLYGLLCLLTCRPSRQVMSEIFIDLPNPSSMGWLIKRWLYRRIARRCSGILTNCSAEIPAIADRYGIPENRLRYVPLHTTIEQPHRSDRDEGYVLAAGRTLRDYTTLLRAAPSIPAPIVILCGRDDLVGTTLPANVTVVRDAPREEYLDRLDRCAVVVVPLLPAERATGQVVILEAMALGKPVVATRAPGSADLVTQGETGILVPPSDPDTLAQGVARLLKDTSQAGRMALKALDRTLNHHTIEIHAQRKLAAIESLWSGQP